MKVINIFLIFVFTCCFTGYAGIPECKKKQSDVSSVLSILNEINSMNIDNIYTDKNNFTEDIINKITDPYVYARLVVLAYYISYPGDIDTVPYDRAFAKCSIQHMSRYKSHPKFVEAMKFIERAIRLDAGESEIFSDVLWNARDIDEVKKHFNERIKSYANSLKKYGSAEEKAAVIKEGF